MNTDTPKLFVEISNYNYIFIAIKYDDDQNLRVVEKIIHTSQGINRNKIIDIDRASETIKKNIEIIEKKLNYVFKDVNVIIEDFTTSCVNISGFKKLNGSQILKENISYILNSLKLDVVKNEDQKSIIHIFNSRSILDGINTDNLPIGLFGNFYSHELTFFLIENNDLKNIKLIFNRNNLNVRKVVLKSFSEGIYLTKQNNSIKSFFKIKFYKENSSIIYFDNDSFRYSEYFNFGTNIILKDISKICSIDIELIENFLSQNLFNKKFNDDEYLEEKYFAKGNFRKIRKKLILEIAQVRINEIINIIFYNNPNLKTFQEDSVKIYLTIKDYLIFNNFGNSFKDFFQNNKNIEISFIDDCDIETLVINTENLLTYGWKKEAIPITQTKNSIITRIFKSLFG